MKTVVGYPFNYFILFFPVAISNCFLSVLHVPVLFSLRWAVVSSHPGNAPQSSREDHRNAARDRQLWAAAHAGVPWDPALQGDSR